MIIPNVYSLDYNDQVSDQRDNLWQLGKNLSVGDSFTYKICDPSAIPNYSSESYHYFTKDKEHNSSLCYVIKLDFVNLLNSDENQINSDIWIVQASISDVLDNSIRHSVFHIDSQSFEVNSADTIHPDTIRYTDSLENTIFSIFKYTASEPKLLQKNVKWGKVTEYLDYHENNPDMKVLQDDLEFHVVQNVIDYSQNEIILKDKTFDTFEVGYSIDIIDNDLKKVDTNNVTNYYLISLQFPFPLSSTLYSPAHVTEPSKESEFQLISFVSDDEITQVIEIEQHNTIEEDITKTDKIIVDEFVEENAVAKIIDESIIEETTIEEEIISVEPVVEEQVEEAIVEEITIDEEITTLDSSLDKSIILVTFLVIIISGVFVYYKKFRNSNNNLKSFVKKNKTVFNKIIHFDENVTITIKSQDKRYNNNST